VVLRRAAGTGPKASTVRPSPCRSQAIAQGWTCRFPRHPGLAASRRTSPEPRRHACV